MKLCNPRSFLALSIFCQLGLMGLPVRAENWPQWRGPRGDGSSAETGLPVKWSATENVAWRSAIPGRGGSTPVVWGDRVFITYQLGKNTTVNDLGAKIAKNVPDAPDAIRTFAACYVAADGKLLWESEVKGGQLSPTHEKHNEATPSCVTDGELVYAWFGTGPVAAFDMDGKPVWQRDLAAEYGPFEVQYGHASSPMLSGNLLVLLCDHMKTAYVLAVDKKTGKNVWKTDHAAPQSSYCTPLAANVAGREELLINTAGRIESLDPATGAVLWFATGLRIVVAAMPLAADGVVYTYGGWDNGPVFAVKGGGQGDVTATHVLWSKKTGGANVPSAVMTGGTIYFVNDGGIACAIDAKSGEQVWKERSGGKFLGSPVLADGRIYQMSDEGETVVFEAVRDGFKVVGRNPVGEPSLGSLAISGGRIYLRTDQSLFCIAAP